MIHQEANIAASAKIWYEHLSNIGKCEIGGYSVIHSHVWIGDGVIIKDGVKVQAFAFIPYGVTIEANAFIGPRVTFLNDLYPPSQGKGWKRTVVEGNASIGGGAVILPGITIGEGALIGAGAVVTKDVPAFEIWAGNPAKFLRKRESPMRASTG